MERLLHRLRDALAKQQLVHHGAVIKHADDDFGAGRCLRRSVGNEATVHPQSLRFFARAVPARDMVSGRTQTLGYGIAHEPDTQYSDFHSRGLWSPLKQFFWGRKPLLTAEIKCVRAPLSGF